MDRAGRPGPVRARYFSLLRSLCGRCQILNIYALNTESRLVLKENKRCSFKRLQFVVRTVTKGFRKYRLIVIASFGNQDGGVRAGSNLKVPVVPMDRN